MSTHAGEVAALRALYQEAHTAWLMGAMQDVTEEMAHWQPPGRVVPIAGHFAHALISEDVLLAMFVSGRKPLITDSFSGRAIVSAPMPLGVWDEWARTVHVDLDGAREYAQAIFDQTDQILANLPEGDLERMLDMSSVGMGTMSVNDLLRTLAIHIGPHTGEISAIKGMQNAKGYAF